MKSFRDIIQALGGGAALAHKIGAKPVTVRAWAQRNSIPAEHWIKVAGVAKAARVSGATVADMARLADSEEVGA